MNEPTKPSPGLPQGMLLNPDHTPKAVPPAMPAKAQEPVSPRPKAVQVDPDESPTIAETDLWLNFACAALTGLLARQNTKFTQDQLAGSAGEYADKMVDQFRKRHA